MINTAILPSDLDFIKEALNIDAAMFRDAPWLLSDFKEPVWKCRLAIRRKVKCINFRVKLDDCSFLTEPKNEPLLEAIKSYLCLMSHPIATGGMDLASSTIARQINYALHIIDYFLLRSDRFQLSLHGFKMVTASDIVALMAILAKGQFTKTNLYAAYEEADFFLKRKLALLTEAQIESTIRQVPGIGVIEPQLNRKLSLSDSELISARVYLWLNGYYNPQTVLSGANGHSYYRHHISPQYLFAAIYQERILSTFRFHLIGLEELHFDPIEKRIREYPMKPSQTGFGDTAMAKKIFNEYCLTLRKMEFLSISGQSLINPNAMSALDNQVFLDQLTMKECGRYQSLPQEVVFASFRHAVEFYFEFGGCLIDTYLALAQEASLKQTSISSLKQAEFHKLLPAKLKNAGVHLWDLSAQYRGRINENKSNFFQRLRANEGLLQLIDILYGAIWVIVATLSARRSGELLELSADKSLLEKSHGFYLCLDLRKRNIANLREHTIRPIPKLAAKCILTLRRLHQQLSLLGYSSKDNILFSKPHYNEVALVTLHYGKSGMVLNRFCDYFELPLDNQGRRYYIRTHQLRRFFAMMFFWSDGFGGLDTLRWYLGHTDVAHIYHYITETVPGAILRRVGAEYASECLRNNNSKADGLGTLLNQRYGLSSFTLMQSDEVADYIEDLMLEGVLQIEPIFFESSNGTRYEIIFKITEKD